MHHDLRPTLVNPGLWPNSHETMISSHQLIMILLTTHTKQTAAKQILNTI